MARHDDKQLITKDELLKLVPYSIRHIYRLMEEGKFPKCVPVGANRVAWILKEIMIWLDERVADRGTDPDAPRS